MRGKVQAGLKCGKPFMFSASNTVFPSDSVAYQRSAQHAELQGLQRRLLVPAADQALQVLPRPTPLLRSVQSCKAQNSHKAQNGPKVTSFQVIS